MLEAGGVVKLLAGKAKDQIHGSVGFSDELAEAVVGAVVGDRSYGSALVEVGYVANRAEMIGERVERVAWSAERRDLLVRQKLVNRSDQR